MTSEPQCDAKHVIQAIGALGETAVEGVTTIVEAAVGNYQLSGVETLSLRTPWWVMYW